MKHINSYWVTLPSFISIFKHKLSVNRILSFSNKPLEMNLKIFNVMYSLIFSILFYAIGDYGASRIELSKSSKKFFKEV